MSNFSASIPVADMQSANDILNNTAGTPGVVSYGPSNFSVPAYNSPSPGFALLHAWGDAEFEAAVAAIPNVTIQHPIVTTNPGNPDTINDNPQEMTSELASKSGAEWAADAKPLTGQVTPGLYRDTDNVLWWVIQAYDTAIYPDPLLVPALIRVAKVPGETLPWQQPLDQYDAYKLVNSFTGLPDQSTHNGFTWKVSQADGAGNNIWEPGVFGWVQV